MLKLKTAGLGITAIAGLMAGAAAQSAGATDVVTVYGNEVAQLARQVEAEFRARMDENARQIDLAIRANIEKEITRIQAPTLLVALSEVSTRG